MLHAGKVSRRIGKRTNQYAIDRALRLRIDHAVEACELLNLAKREAMPRWIQDVVAELAAIANVECDLPHTPTEAPGLLMDLMEALP